MFTAQVYRIAIPSAGTILKEDRIVHEAISRWSAVNGEKAGTILLPIPSECADVVPDIYIFNIDNYVDAAKVESAIATGARVVLFFRQSHDPGNTVSGELKAVEEFREKVQGICPCYQYNDSLDYENALYECFLSVS